MAFLHCHGFMPDGTRCDWEQDDFWDIEGYTPFRSDTIQYLKECLFKDKVYSDEEYFLSHLDLKSHLDDFGAPYCKGTDYVAHSLIHKANSIKNMQAKTWEEWKIMKDTLKCPKCGSKKWDID